MLHVEPHLPCHLADDLHVDGRCVLLVVNGEQGDAPLVLGNDGIGGDDAGTARLATAFGGDGHTNLADTRIQLGTLEGVLLETVTEFFFISLYSTAQASLLRRPQITNST